MPKCTQKCQQIFFSGSGWPTNIDISGNVPRARWINIRIHHTDAGHTKHISVPRLSWRELPGKPCLIRSCSHRSLPMLCHYLLQKMKNKWTNYTDVVNTLTHFSRMYLPNLINRTTLFPISGVFGVFLLWFYFFIFPNSNKTF